MIIGKNNAGKTTIITALDNLINHSNAFGANDFNYRYLQEYLNDYDVNNPPLSEPYIEFKITIELEEDSSDRISNLIPFMLVEDIEDSELDICIRYEVGDLVFFQSEMKESFSEGKDKNAFAKFLNLCNNICSCSVGPRIYCADRTKTWASRQKSHCRRQFLMDFCA